MKNQFISKEDLSTAFELLDMYWDLLEEQHAHDVVISVAMEGSEEEDERSDLQTGGD